MYNLSEAALEQRQNRKKDNTLWEKRMFILMKRKIGKWKFQKIADYYSIKELQNRGYTLDSAIRLLERDEGETYKQRDERLKTEINFKPYSRQSIQDIYKKVEDKKPHQLQEEYDNYIAGK